MEGEVAHQMNQGVENGSKVRIGMRAGKLFGGAHTEQGGPKPGEINTRLSRDGDRYRLNGRKWYATGTAFADYASFSAKTEDGEFYAALKVAKKLIAHADGQGDATATVAA